MIKEWWRLSRRVHLYMTFTLTPFHEHMSLLSTVLHQNCNSFWTNICNYTHLVMGILQAKISHRCCLALRIVLATTFQYLLSIPAMDLQTQSCTKPLTTDLDKSLKLRNMPASQIIMISRYGCMNLIHHISQRKINLFLDTFI